MSEIFEAMGIDPGIIIIILMVTTVHERRGWKISGARVYS